MRLVLFLCRPTGVVCRVRIACAVIVAAASGVGAQAQLGTNSRWTNTATDGSNFGQGNPTTLTWSIIPDGTTSGNGGASDLIDFFDGLYGDGGGSDLTQRPWFFIFEQPMDRYTALSGLTIVYEPNDDGVRVRSSNTGTLGVRGDVRMGGDFIDGPSNTLAFASFPNNGDITYDTGDANFYNGRSNNSRAARNVVAHEFGHSIGQDHVESSNARFLMEPFISTQFDGPQLYDILALHRLYGDVHEKANGGNGNNTSSNATSMGTLASGVTTRIGTDAGDTTVSSTDIDFISIDDNNDTDFLSFTIDSPAFIDLTLTPMGPTFNIAPQDQSQNVFDASAQSDLALALFDTDGTTLLGTSDFGGVGDTESILGLRLDDAGTYFARITGATNLAQLYQLDLLSMAILDTPDLNGDGFVGLEDLDVLLANWGGAGASPAAGDANGDGTVDSDDLDIVINNWGQGTPPGNLIPEPGSLALLLVGGLAMGRRRRV